MSKRFDWSIKILEQAGVPLLNSFIFKFPIENGCPRRGTCTLCKNDTLKCSVKGVIYRGHCVDCQTVITGDAGYVPDKDIPTYIGETSRPARERISEHVRNVLRWSKDSVILHHWMDRHSTDTVIPTFKFEVLASYCDPLRRQLTEAILISKQGTLNGKSEFGVNEIIKLEGAATSREQEERLKTELEKRQRDKIKIQSFIDVMSNVFYLNTQIVTNSRSEKRAIENMDSQAIINKRQKVNTSTPTQWGSYRESQLIPDDTSPILLEQAVKDTSDDETGVIESVNRTEVSGNLDKNKLTPDKLLSESKEDQNIAGGARDLSNAAKKSTSMPNLSWDNIENSMFKPYQTRNKLHVNRARSVSIDYTEWSNDDFPAETELVQVEIVDAESDKMADTNAQTGTESEKVIVDDFSIKPELSLAVEVDAESNKRLHKNALISSESEKVIKLEEELTIGDTVRLPGNENTENQCWKLNKIDSNVETESDKVFGVDEDLHCDDRRANGRKIITPNRSGSVCGSPKLRQNKRVLNVSPSTPIGLPRKHLFRETQDQLNSITFSEDVDMVDISVKETITCSKPDFISGICSTPNTPDDRKIIKGFRRLNTDGTSPAILNGGGNRVLTGIVEQLVSQNENQGKVTGGVNYKGISVNQLRRNVRSNSVKPSTNYKSTRKKRENKAKKFTETLDKNQRRIHDFYQTKPNNKVILGPSDDKKPLGSTLNGGESSKLI